MKQIGIKSAGILLGGSLLMSGCSSEQVQQMVTATTEQPAQDEHTKLNYCVDTSLDAHARILGIDTEKCAAMTKTGKIALVGYGISRPVMNRLAKDTLTLLSQETNGIVTPTIDVKLATTNQIISLDEVANSCVNPHEVSQTPASIAEQSDPTLADYDLVIGVTTKPPCNDDEDSIDVKAAFSPQDGGRYITIYSANTHLPRPDIISEDSEGYTRIEAQQYDAGVGVHEILHGFGLGHANGLVGNNIEDVLDETKSPKVVDVAKLIRKGQLEEYGDYSNIMGSENPDVTKLNESGNEPLANIQLAWLNEPLVRHNNAQELLTELSDSPVVVEAHKAYVATLPNNVLTSDFKQGEETYLSNYGADVVYDQIALFDPSQETERPGQILAVYLVSSTTHDMVSLGWIFPTENDDQITLKYDSLKVQIDFAIDKTILKTQED